MAAPMVVIARETLTLLRRDRIFVPGVLALVAIGAFAVVAAEWSVEEFDRVLFDIGLFGFQFTGGLVAVFWGVKLLNDSRQDGAIEVQLASPISRPRWLLGKYLGLVAALLLLGVLTTATWQILLKAAGYEFMSQAQWAAFFAMQLGWLVLGALAIFLGTFLRMGVALFSAVSLWVSGLVSALIYHNLPETTGRATALFVKMVATAWNLQQFNLVDQASGLVPLSGMDLVWRAAYGGSMVLLLITSGCVIFTRRDLI